MSIFNPSSRAGESHTKTKEKDFSSIKNNCEINENKLEKQEKRSIQIISSLVTIISISLIIYTLINSQALQQQFSYKIQTYGIPSLFILSFFLDLIPQVISPIVTLAAGILAGINIYYAIAATILGSTMGSILGFALGKKYMCKAVYLTIAKPTRKKVAQLANKYGKIIVLLAAISPLPYLPVLLGAMNLTKKNFLIYGLIPRATGIIIYAYLANLF
jgi:membrane protein YqaA with SNARE-associated domain